MGDSIIRRSGVLILVARINRRTQNSCDWTRSWWSLIAQLGSTSDIVAVVSEASRDRDERDGCIIERRRRLGLRYDLGAGQDVNKRCRTHHGGGWGLLYSFNKA